MNVHYCCISGLPGNTGNDRRWPLPVRGLQRRPPQLESFLAKHGRKSTGLFGFNKGLRYAEGVLEEGESVTVFGRRVWENDGSGTRRLIISQPRDGQLRVSKVTI